MLITNYMTSALRNIARNKLYAIINIVGLTMGITVYLFANILVDYEYSHDTFYQNSDRIYTVGLNIRPEANAGITEMNAVPSAVLPHIKTELPELKTTARTYIKEFLISVSGENYYQKLRFADPELLSIFNFDYVYGDSTALSNPAGMLITESTAKRLFADDNPIGKTITIDHQNDLVVTAVIKDPPANTHLNSYFLENIPFQMIISMAAMERIADVRPDEDWEEMHPTNLTYILLPENLDHQWLEAGLNGVYQKYFTEGHKKFASGIFANPLIEANLSHWKLIGLPILTAIKTLGFLVLIIASVNYINLAAAQSMKRTREVGLRKVHGAGKRQLWTQFIIESITITLIAMLLAISLLELAIPIFNLATGKILSLNYIETLPWLITTTMVVGFLSGSYPAYMIGKTNPIESLYGTWLKGRSSLWIRGLMSGTQFAISVFMLALALVVISQNDKVQNSSNVFPKEQIYVLEGFDVPQIAERQALLKNEISSIAGIENFAFSSQVPYEATQHVFQISSIINDFDKAFNINRLVMDYDFLDTYNMKLVAGRILSDNFMLDNQPSDSKNFNVIINEMTAQNLKFKTPEQAIGNVFYSLGNEGAAITYTIVGVIENQNILGLHNGIKPFIMLTIPSAFNEASIKISSAADPQIIQSIEAAWKRVIPEYPMRGRYLTEVFQDLFGIFSLASKSLTAIAIFALILAMIGLFGLSAFMAEQRTKEIGIRKVHGATPPQVVHLLVLQFSKSAIIALPFALGAAYLASTTYLEFFDDRIAVPYDILLFAGLIGLLLSWATVAGNSYAVARQNPINALRYE